MRPDPPASGASFAAVPTTYSLTTLLTPQRVRVRLDAASKPDVLRAMVLLTARAREVRDWRKLLADVQAREALISTGVGQGLALPHARTAAVTETVGAFATLAEPVDYASLDGAPVRIVLLIAGPEHQKTQHLRLMSRASRVMADPETRQRLLDAPSPESVLDVLADAEDHLR